MKAASSVKRFLDGGVGKTLAHMAKNVCDGGRRISVFDVVFIVHARKLWFTLLCQWRVLQFSHWLKENHLSIKGSVVI